MMNFPPSVSSVSASLFFSVLFPLCVFLIARKRDSPAAATATVTAPERAGARRSAPGRGGVGCRHRWPGRGGRLPCALRLLTDVLIDDGVSSVTPPDAWLLFFSFLRVPPWLLCHLKGPRLGSGKHPLEEKEEREPRKKNYW